MKKLSIILILAAGCLWGSMGLFYRILNSYYGFNSLQIVSLRLISAAIAFIIFTIMTDKTKLHIKFRDVPLLFFTGVCGVLLMAATYSISIGMTSLSVAAILMYTAPIMVMAASIVLFKEKLTNNKVIAATLAFCGCILISGIMNDDARVTSAGIIMGLISAAAYGSYSIFGTYALRKHHSFTVTAWAFIFAAAGSVFIADAPDMIRKFSVCQDLTKAIVLAASFGIFTAFAPFLLYTVGLTKIEASKAIILASVEPLVATLIGFIAFGEKLDVFSLMGIAFIIFSILVLNNFGKTANYRPAERNTANVDRDTGEVE